MLRKDIEYRMSIVQTNNKDETITSKPTTTNNNMHTSGTTTTGTTKLYTCAYLRSENRIYLLVTISVKRRIYGV